MSLVESRAFDRVYPKSVEQQLDPEDELAPAVLGLGPAFWYSRVGEPMRQEMTRRPTGSGSGGRRG